MLLPQNLTGLHPWWIHFWIAKLLESFMAKSGLVTDHTGPAPRTFMSLSCVSKRHERDLPEALDLWIFSILFHPKSGSFHAIGIEFSLYSLLRRQRLVWWISWISWIQGFIIIIIFLMMATFGVPLDISQGTSVLRVSACTGRAVGVACFRSGGFNPIHDSQAIINEPYFDNLYHPLMVILGMVYYCFTNIVLVNLLNPSTRCLQWCVHATGKPDGRIASACSARSLSTSS